MVYPLVTERILLLMSHGRDPFFEPEDLFIFEHEVLEFVIEVDDFSKDQFVFRDLPSIRMEDVLNCSRLTQPLDTSTLVK